jgi:hypothetical protein
MRGASKTQAKAMDGLPELLRNRSDAGGQRSILAVLSPICRTAAARAVIEGFTTKRKAENDFGEQQEWMVATGCWWQAGSWPSPILFGRQISKELAVVPARLRTKMNS